MLILTNRSITATESSDHQFPFGEKLNEAGNATLSFGAFTFSGQDVHQSFETASAWQFEAYDKTAFAKAWQALRSNGKPTLVFLHGFDQSLAKNLHRCQWLEDLYHVNVVLISWPSRPKILADSTVNDKALRYLTNRSRSRAKRSAGALLQALQHIQTLEKTNYTAPLNLLVHSMGTLVLKTCLETFPEAIQHFSPYTNMLVHQAEVPNKSHELWMNQLGVQTQLFVTINEGDKALKLTEYLKTKRLGTSRVNHTCSKATYLDFTEVEGVADEHLIFLKCGKLPFVHAIFKSLFAGASFKFKSGVTNNTVVLNPNLQTSIIHPDA